MELFPFQFRNWMEESKRHLCRTRRQRVAACSSEFQRVQGCGTVCPKAAGIGLSPNEHRHRSIDRGSHGISRHRKLARMRSRPGERYLMAFPIVTILSFILFPRVVQAAMAVATMAASIRPRSTMSASVPKRNCFITSTPIVARIYIIVHL